MKPANQVKIEEIFSLLNLETPDKRESFRNLSELGNLANSFNFLGLQGSHRDEIYDDLEKQESDARLE